MSESDPSIPSPPPSGKPPRRILLFAPFIALGVGAVVWSGAWLAMKSRLEAGLDRRAEAARATGRDLSWASRRVGGYPFRLVVELTDARASEPSGWSLRAPRLRAEAYAYSPGRWVVTAPEGVVVGRPRGGPLAVQGRLVRASVEGLGGDRPALSFEGRQVAFVPGAGAAPFALTEAEAVQIRLQPGPDDQGAVLVRVEEGLMGSQGALARIAPLKPVSVDWRARLSRLSALKGPDWPDMVRAWAAAGGSLSVDQAGVSAGDAGLTVRDGLLTVGADGRLRGRLPLSLRRGADAIAALGEGEAIDRDAARNAAAVAEARQGAGETALLALVFEAGVATIGPVSLGPALRVY